MLKDGERSEQALRQAVLTTWNSMLAFFLLMSCKVLRKVSWPSSYVTAGKRMQKVYNGIYMYVCIYIYYSYCKHSCIVTVHHQISKQVKSFQIRSLPKLSEKVKFAAGVHPRRLGSTPEGDEMHQHTGSLQKMGMFPARLFIVRKENSSSWSSTWLPKSANSIRAGLHKSLEFTGLLSNILGIYYNLEENSKNLDDGNPSNLILW